jgi:hypothetical protein
MQHIASTCNIATFGPWEVGAVGALSMCAEYSEDEPFQ